MAQQQRKPNRCYEQMSRFKFYRYTVRVWTASPEFKMGPHYMIDHVVDNLRALAASLKRSIEPNDIIIQLEANIEHITDIEILDYNGNGGIVYPDWKVEPDV